MSRVLIDLTGKRFGMLVVIYRWGFIQKNTKQPTWLCRCDCGDVSIVEGSNLRKGATRSCGCLKKANGRIHGMTGSPEHQTWRGMIARCTDVNNSHYPKYGGRGIKVCERWLTFEGFYADMAPRPKGTSLDRFPDNTGDYEPNNCRWAFPKEQSRNTERTAFITFRNETLCRKDWAARLGITDGALKNRLSKWSLEDAMTKCKQH